jgi:hypothetical protein
MADYNKLKMGDNKWVFLYSSTNGEAYSYDYTITNSSDPQTSPGVSASNYEPEEVMRVSDGGFPTTTYYWYVVDKETMTAIYVDSTEMDCVVIDGTIMFGKMENPSISGLTKDDSSVNFTLTNNNNWDTGSCRIYYELGDSTPDANYANVNCGSSTNLNITGLTANTTYTLYARTYYNGVYSGTVSQQFTTDAASQEWSFVSTTTTEPPYDVFVEDTEATSELAAKNALEAAYPADNQTINDIGVVYDRALFYYVFEVS